MAVRRSMAWMASGQAAFFVLQFLGSVAIARLLSPYDVGVFAVAVAVVGLVSVIQAVGLNSYLVRAKEMTPQVVATTATVNWLLAFAISAIVALAGIGGEYLFRERGVRDVLLVIALVPLIGAAGFVPTTMLERASNFRVLAIVRTGSTAFGLALTVGLALHGFRYMSFAYSQIVTAILTNAAIVLVARQTGNFSFSLVGARVVAKYALQMLAISGLVSAATRMMEIILGRIQGLAALGLYSRASGNHNMLWDSVQGVIGRVVFVDFAQHVAGGGSLRDRYLKVLETITGLLWPLFGGVALLSGPIVRLIYGEAWIGAAAPLTLLCVASMILSSVAMSAEIFVIRHETNRQVRIVFVRTAVGVALFILGCLHSLEAAAGSRILDALFLQWLYRPHLGRMIEAQTGDFRQVYVRSGIATVVACAPAAILMAAWRFSPHVPLAYLIATVVLGIAFWLVALRVQGHFLFEEIGRFISKVRARKQVV